METFLIHESDITRSRVVQWKSASILFETYRHSILFAPVHRSSVFDEFPHRFIL